MRLKADRLRAYAQGKWSRRTLKKTLSLTQTSPTQTLEIPIYQRPAPGPISALRFSVVSSPWENGFVGHPARLRPRARCRQTIERDRVRSINLKPGRAAPPTFPRPTSARPPKPGGSCDGSSSTTSPSMQAGLTWSRSRSASCAASVWIAESTIPSDCAAKSPPGRGGEMPPAPASNGCSQQTRPAPKWAAPIRPLPTSHNHCAEVLVWFYEGSVSLAAKEGRDIENSLLDRIAHGGEAAVRIEAPRSMARIFRNRLCRRPFGVADRGAQRRTP